MQRRGGRLVALVVGTSLVAACSGGGGEAEEPPSPSSSSPVSSESSESSGSSESAVPVMPEEARGDDDAAAVAFVEHWVEVLNYGLITGESGPLEELVNPQCITCEGLVDTIDDQGGPETRGQWTPSDLRASASNSEADVVVSAQIVISGESREPYGTATFGLAREAGGWSVEWLTAEPAE